MLYCNALSNASFNAAAASSLGKKSPWFGAAALQSPTAYSTPNTSLTPPPPLSMGNTSLSVPMVTSRPLPSSQAFGSLVVPNGSALKPKLQVVLSVFDLLSKNAAFVSAARSQFHGHKCCAACPVCTLADVQKLSAGHREAARKRLEDTAAELRNVSIADGAAYCLQFALVGLERASMGVAPSIPMFSWEKLVKGETLMSPTNLPSSLFLHVDAPVSGMDLYKMGALGLSLASDSGETRYEMKAAVMRVMLPNGAWHFYTVELREGVWRTSRANYAVLLIGEAQLVLAERVPSKPFPAFSSPQALLSMSVPMDVRCTPSPSLPLASSHTQSSNDTLLGLAPEVVMEDAELEPELEEEEEEPLMAASPPPAFLTVNGHEVEMHGVGEQGFTVELMWPVAHQPSNAVQPTTDMQSLAHNAQLEEQVEGVLRQLGLCDASGGQPWIRMTSAHAASELVAMLKGWTVVQRDGETTCPASDGEVAQVINLSSSRHARSQGPVPEFGTMAVRFTLLPARDDVAANRQVALMTCLYRRGSLERPFGSQPIVEVDAMALFGRLPASPLELPASVESDEWVVMKGVNATVESVLTDKLGFSWVESLKSKPLRKRGCRHGMRTVRMATAGQVEFLTVHLGHLFLGTGPCGRKQSRFLKFERDRRQADRKH